MTNTTERITKIPGAYGGKACIAGHRIRVMDSAIRYEHLGTSADEIVTTRPTLSLGDVCSAPAYYFHNIEEIREDTRRNDELAELFRT